GPRPPAHEADALTTRPPWRYDTDVTRTVQAAQLMDGTYTVRLGVRVSGKKVYYGGPPSLLGRQTIGGLSLGSCPSLQLSRGPKAVLFTKSHEKCKMLDISEKALLSPPTVDVLKRK
ncbi:MAG: hypothetical protein KAG66_05940, partial [Methylococcales bacterium]|nr:hypothetical protein [Methylococcales bacterium]